MTRHCLTIDRPDRFFTVTCPCGFHAVDVPSFPDAHDRAFEHLGLPLRPLAVTL